MSGDGEHICDKEQIREVLLRYCRGVDRCDADLIGSAYHADAIDHHGAITATGAEIGPILAKKLAEHYRATMHQVTNLLIEVSGDTAASESYYVARHLFERDGVETLLEGVGATSTASSAAMGVWRISARTVVTDWAHFLPFTGERPEFTSPPSHRSRDDLSYQNFMIG